MPDTISIEASDRELLELAAKAAGLDVQWHCAAEEVDDRADYFAATEGMWLKGHRTPAGDKYWNPLADDGDALRLAVKLHINIEHLRPMGGQFNEVCASPAGRGDCLDIRRVESDPYAATRRAVVRAAAEIARQASDRGGER